jgi:hypothetical protein
MHSLRPLTFNYGNMSRAESCKRKVALGFATSHHLLRALHLKWRTHRTILQATTMQTRNTFVLILDQLT